MCAVGQGLEPRRAGPRLWGLNHPAVLSKLTSLQVQGLGSPEWEVCVVGVGGGVFGLRRRRGPAGGMGRAGRGVVLRASASSIISTTILNTITAQYT